MLLEVLYRQVFPMYFLFLYYFNVTQISIYFLFTSLDLTNLTLNFEPIIKQDSVSK